MMTTNEQNKCAHLPCRCMVQPGEKYCGQACKEGRQRWTSSGESDELNARHRGVVTLARPELQDPGVPTGAIAVARSDLGEELVGHVLVADERDDASLGVDRSLG